MALACIIDGWDVQRWREILIRLAPGHEIFDQSKACANRDAVNYALVWNPARGVLKQFGNLKIIFNLGAGVDALLADPSLPDVPLVRVVDANLTARMSEYVVQHVLMHHRQHFTLCAQQATRVWKPLYQWPASEVCVGIMGLGILGADAATKLQALGFSVAGWSRTRKTFPGIGCYHGDGQVDQFLNRSNILVCLLPLTAQTRGILNRNLFRKLSGESPLGAPVIINAGRGGLQKAGDIIASLDAGELGGASLDVFETEPLGRDSPLWTHNRVLITPHMAADSDPVAISRNVLRQIANFEQGRPLENIVDRTLGY